MVSLSQTVVIYVYEQSEVTEKQKIFTEVT